MANPDFSLIRKRSACPCGDTSWESTGDERCKGADVERKELSNCGNTRWVVDRAQTWTPTGDTRCNNNLVEQEEVNDCGKSRWSATTTACGFCPSYPVPLDRCDGQSAYAYRDGDVKDPLATVEIADCDGGPSVWVYPSAGAGHSVEVYDCDGNVLGYGANVSECVSNEIVRTQILDLPELNVAPVEIAKIPTLDLNPLKIAEIPEIKVGRHLVEAIQVGNEVWTYWSDGVKEIETLPVTPDPIVYCPSLRLSCDGKTPGYGYHIADPKDPAATVEMAPCAGDNTVDSIWIYPSAGPGHTVKVTDCDGNVIGYAANRSDCAADYGCAEPEIKVNVTNKFSPTTNVAAPAVTNNFAPVNNTTLPAPNLVALQIANDGTVTGTNSDGSTVVSNPLPSC